MTDQNSEIVENPDVLDTCQSSIDDSDEAVLKQKIDELKMKQYRQSDLPELVSAIYSNDRFKQIYGVIGVKKLLSVQTPPIQMIIDENLVPKLIEFIQNKNEPHLQLESAWALSNIASGTTEQTQTIVENGGLPIFIELLKSPRLDVVDQVMWAIGNIAGDSTSFRDMLLTLGALEPLLQIANNIKEKDILKNCVWAIYTLCRGKPLPSPDRVKSAIPTLSRILQTENDPAILCDSTWALTYLPQVTIDDALAKEVISALLRHINGPYLALLIPSLRILRNIAADENVQSIALENPQYLSTLFKLTCHHNATIRTESCWTISIITGDANQIQSIIEKPYYIDILIKISTSDVLEVRKEALSVLVNPIDHLSPEQLAEFVDLGVLDCFVYLLDSDEPEILELATCGVLGVLDKGVQMDQVGRVTNDFQDIFIDKKGVEKLEKLKFHSNKEVKSTACTILDKHLEISI